MHLSIYTVIEKLPAGIIQGITGRQRVMPVIQAENEMICSDGCFITESSESRHIRCFRRACRRPGHSGISARLFECRNPQVLSFVVTKYQRPPLE